VAAGRRRALHAIVLLAAAHLDFSIVRDAAPELARGALVTFEITLAGLAGSLALGVLGAAARTSPSRLARGAATAFVEFFRNTPPLVHIFFAYFALPALGVNVPGFVAATVALILYQGAIAVEILRAGLEAVPLGQLEAADALGLRGFERFCSVVAPQALRISLPALGNNMISLFKNTSLVSAIGVLDITGVAQDVIAQRLSSAELYLTIGIFYLICVFAFSVALRYLEARLTRYGA
jgi:His/Glu/Gln/Arg/opine family amino acid ABC transporter permease subunit